MMRPPVTIITGFLGSGKTTLLRHLLETGLPGRRVALVVNEVGDIPFDGRLLEGRHVEAMVELTSGCICCSLGSAFLFAIEELVETVEPELILIETTGVAEPLGLARQVRAADLPLDSIVAVADAANLAATLERSEVARWQLRAADFVALNKCDLVTPAQIDAARRRIRAENERALLVETSHGQIDWGMLLAPRAPMDGRDRAFPDHLHADGIASFVWRSDGPLVRATLDTTLASLPAVAYRVKGHVHCSDAPWPTLVNVVCGRATYEDTRFKQSPAYLNELVVIGALEGLEDDLRACFAACAETGERRAVWLQRHVES